jgi:dephospho-CoA kinase
MTMSPFPLEIPTSTRGRRWKHGAVPVIGLIGGIGSGKSRAAAALAARGAVIIDADQVGHEVLDQPDVSRAVVQRFGDKVVRESGTDGSESPRIDRRALGSIVFADPTALEYLEALLHPRMERQFQEVITKAVQEGTASAIILDAAILLERGWDRFCDLVVFVEAPWAVRLQRVFSTRGWSAETLRARELAQWPIEAKRARADMVLRNDAGVESLEQSADWLLAWLSRPDAVRSLAPVPCVPQASPGPAAAVPGEAR